MGVVIIGQLVERFYYAREMNRQLTKQTAALFARNIQDYLQATKEDKPQNDIPSPPDEVFMEDADDPEFDNYIENVNK